MLGSLTVKLLLLSEARLTHLSMLGFSNLSGLMLCCTCDKNSHTVANKERGLLTDAGHVERGLIEGGRGYPIRVRQYFKRLTL